MVRRTIMEESLMSDTATQQDTAQSSEQKNSNQSQEKTEKRGGGKWDIPFLHILINPDKKHAVGYLLAAIVSAVAVYAFQEGLQTVKEMWFPDPKVAKLAQIQSSSDSITSTVNEIKAKLNSTEPFDPSGLIAKLDFITQQNSNLLPLAQGLANANSGYVRGAKVMHGPFEGVGSFYMDLNNGQSAGMTQVCGNATVTYEPVRKQFRLDHEGRSDIQYLTNPGAMKLNGISVVVHSAFDSNGSLQLTYDCGKKA